ncbi:MAG: DUF1127 domain-containing protein [Rhizobiaceae bacterium]|nr:DUF1127 domain-containing protein [Rhizobiaceae bacterium]
MTNVRSVLRDLEYGLIAGAAKFVEIAARFFVRLECNLVEEKKRDELRSLLKFEDHQLRDMGISRDDVKSALMQPLDVNSGHKMESARRSRRWSL